MMGMTKKNNMEIYRENDKTEKIDPLIAFIIALSSAILFKVEENIFERVKRNPEGVISNIEEDIIIFSRYFGLENKNSVNTLFARSVMDEYFPIAAEDSYVEQGYTVRIARTDAMVKMLNIAIVLVEIVMYGFVILLVLMGFTSVISTLTTNIRIRSREFAVLKSVGMTNKSLCRMLYSESIFCVLNALVPGVILGIAIPFLINLSIRKAFPVLYHIPWAALFGGIFVLIGIVFFITRTEIHKIRDKSIIDEIRMAIV
jgi:putative ABC transport system permease protein